MSYCHLKFRKLKIKPQPLPARNIYRESYELLYERFQFSIGRNFRKGCLTNWDVLIYDRNNYPSQCYVVFNSKRLRYCKLFVRVHFKEIINQLICHSVLDV